MAQPPVSHVVGSGTSAASHTSASFSPGPSRRIIVAGWAAKASPALASKPTIADNTSGAITWTEVRNQHTSDAVTADIWGVLWISNDLGSSPPTNITVTIAATGATLCQVGVWSVASADADSVVQAAGGEDLSNGDPSFTLGSAPSPENNVFGVAFGRNASAAAVYAPPSGYVELSDSASATNYRLESFYALSNAPQGPNQAVSTNSRSLIMAMELSPGPNTPVPEIGTTGAASSTSAAFTPLANTRLVAVTFAARVGAQAVKPTITDSLGLTWVECGDVETSNTTTADLRQTIYLSDDVGGSPSSMTVTVSSTSAGASGGIVMAVPTSAISGTVTQVASGEDLSNGDPSFSFASAPDSGAIVVGGVYAVGTADIAPPVWATEISDGLASGGGTRIMTFARGANASQSGATSSTNTRSIILAVEFAPAGAGTQTLTPSLVTDGDDFYSPVVLASYGLAPGLLANAGSFPTAAVLATYGLTPARLANAQTFYAPLVVASYGLAPALFTGAQTFFAPTVLGSYALTPARFDSAQAFYAPTVTRGAITLLPGVLSNGQTFYAAVVSSGSGPQTLLPGILANSQVFPAAVMVRGAITLVPPLLALTTLFPAAAIIRGAVNLVAARFDNSAAPLAPIVVPGPLFLTPPLLVDVDAFYAPALAAWIDLRPALLADPDVFFEVAIVGGTAVITPYQRVRLLSGENRIIRLRGESRNILLSGL